MASIGELGMGGDDKLAIIERGGISVLFGAQILFKFLNCLIIFLNIHITDGTEIKRLLMTRVMREIFLEIVDGSLEVIGFMIVLLGCDQKP